VLLTTEALLAETLEEKKGGGAPPWMGGKVGMGGMGGLGAMM